jgi:hypothetical protein
MKWIEGPTLDIYVSEMLHRRDVLLHLSEEWLRLLNALQTSGIAHGDLQHGNIIVEHGQLRLVDHDGIFVPKMAGWAASEVGHQHYQHPQRDAQHFDEKLDRFSSLVIYLSLLALADQPGLWQEYHDENLLFTKADFADPESSPLFQKIREIGPEHARLAEALAGAAVGPPHEVPCLLDLVKTKSSLPPWMTAPADLDTKTKTREVAAPALPADARTIRWIPWQDKSRSSRTVPATPASSTVQTLFGGAPAAPIIVKDPQDVLRNTFTFSKEFLRRYFLAWYWGAYLLLKFVGFGFFLSLFVGLFCLAIACLTFGVVKAIEESRKPSRLSGLPAWQQPGISAPPPNQQPFSWNVQPPPPSTSPAITASDPFVGNLVLGIFHLENCHWVDRISLKNRVGFASIAEAQSHGFKPCRICSPVT